jgi:hypothetical protein
MSDPPKGKGKERAAPALSSEDGSDQGSAQSGTAAQQQQQASLASRVVSSARDLAANITSSAGTGEFLRQGLSESEGLRQKGQSSSTSANSGPLLRHDTTGPAAASSNLGLSNSPAGAGFRSAASVAQLEQELAAEADFAAFLDSTPVQDLSQPLSDSALGSSHISSDQHTFLSSTIDGQAPINNQLILDSAWQASTPIHQDHLQHQDPQDGLAVFELLNNPAMNDLVDGNALHGPEDAEQQFLQNSTGVDEPRYEPTDAQLGALKPAPGVTNPRNLIPDALNTLSAIPPSASSSSALAGTSHGDGGLNDETRFENLKAQEAWIADWEGVLKNYMRDVWTDLEPLITDAKTEIERGEPGKETVALEKLGRAFAVLKSKL